MKKSSHQSYKLLLGTADDGRKEEIDLDKSATPCHPEISSPHVRGFGGTTHPPIFPVTFVWKRDEREFASVSTLPKPVEHVSARQCLSESGVVSLNYHEPTKQCYRR